MALIGKLEHLRASIETFIQTMHEEPVENVQLDCRALRGGLESSGVTQVRTRFSSAKKDRSRVFVVKQGARGETREATIYREVLPQMSRKFAPMLYGVHDNGNDLSLFLEQIRPAHRWPWPEPRHARAVMEALADLHGAEIRLAAEEWNYCEGLRKKGEELHALLAKVRCDSELAFARRSINAVGRLLSRLPELRRTLLEDRMFPRTFIHGDVHPGNVMLRKENGELRPVFLDWARGRMGSPLEDVSSWLQSLGYWEPEGRRRHDTLFAGYLQARGMPGRITDEIRGKYWLAAASNALAGAALYHFAVADDPRLKETKKAEGRRALADCLRVLRRADAYWRDAAG